MFLGIYLPYWFAKRGCKTENFGTLLKETPCVIQLVSNRIWESAIARSTVTVINYFALQQPYPIGFSMPQEAVLAFLPLGAIFNAIVALYTIPIGNYGVTVCA